MDLNSLLAIFGLFLAVGFLAQLVDGALGMAYGVISSSVLLAFGVPPAQISATVHAAECFTTGASSISHMTHKNVDWKLFFRLAPAGIVGGVIGAYVLTSFDPTLIKALVIVYLAVLGVFPISAMSPGTSVFGPTARTSGTPSVVSAWMSERATRECTRSPTMATVSSRKSCLK